MNKFLKELALGLACFNVTSGYTEDYTVVETLARDISINQ